MGLEWLVGVVLSVVGNVLTNLGTNVLKLGHNKRLKLPIPHPAYKDRFWQAGLVMYGIGNVAMFYAFGYAAQSILAAIGCIQFISNVVFAWLVCQEKATRHILTATALVVAGCVLLVVFGNHGSEELTVQQLLDLYKNRAYIAYLAIGGATVGVSYVLYWLGSRAITAKRSRHIRCWTAAMPILYSLFSALVCTQSLVFNKAVMVLWRMTLAGDNQFNKWVTWLMVLAFLLTAGLWILQLNKGLQRFPALIIVPCMQLCWTLLGVVSGLLYFREYDGMSGLQVAMFVVGLWLVCVGAGMLAHASQHDSTPAADNHRDDDAAVDAFVAACAAEHPQKPPPQHGNNAAAQQRPARAAQDTSPAAGAAEHLQAPPGKLSNQGSLATEPSNPSSAAGHQREGPPGNPAPAAVLEDKWLAAYAYQYPQSTRGLDYSGAAFRDAIIFAQAAAKARAAEPPKLKPTQEEWDNNAEVRMAAIMAAYAEEYPTQAMHNAREALAKAAADGPCKSVSGPGHQQSSAALQPAGSAPPVPTSVALQPPSPASPKAPPGQVSVQGSLVAEPSSNSTSAADHQREGQPGNPAPAGVLEDKWLAAYAYQYPQSTLPLEFPGAALRQRWLDAQAAAKAGTAEPPKPKPTQEEWDNNAEVRMAAIMAAYAEEYPTQAMHNAREALAKAAADGSGKGASGPGHQQSSAALQPLGSAPPAPTTSAGLQPPSPASSKAPPGKLSHQGSLGTGALSKSHRRTSRLRTCSVSFNLPPPVIDP